MAKSQRGIGVILSYLLLVLNMIVGIFITPYIVGALGKSEYGLYNTIASFANALMLLDFGLGTTISRYISKCKAEKDENGEQKVSFIVLLQTIVISTVVFIIGIGMYLLIPKMYSSLSADEVIRSQQVFLLLVFNIVLTLFDHFFVGVASANERFLFINSSKITRILLRVLLIFVLLESGSNAVTLATIDLSLTILFLLIDFLYSFIILKTRIKFCRPEKALAIEIFLFGTTILLQAFVNQVNSNVDKIILGVMTTTSIVAVYSVAMQIFSIFNSLSSAMSSVYLPYVTRMIHSNDEDDTSLVELVSTPGRKQFMICGLALLGFIFVGKDFIRLWMGDDYLDAWLIALIIMIPSLIELIENVAVSVTLAKGKNGIRTAIIAAASIFNIVFSIILVNIMGYIGAPIATALSYLLGYIISVNIFYVKVLKLDVIKVYKNIFSRTWICLLATAALSIPMLLFGATNFILLIAKALYITGIFIILLFIYGFTEDEKRSIISILNKLNLRRIKK